MAIEMPILFAKLRTASRTWVWGERNPRVNSNAPEIISREEVSPKTADQASLLSIISSSYITIHLISNIPTTRSSSLRYPVHQSCLIALFIFLYIKAACLLSTGTCGFPVIMLILKRLGISETTFTSKAMLEMGSSTNL